MSASDTPVSVDVFLDEYSRDDVIAKYLAETAGDGVAHALTHVYAPVYQDAVRALITLRPTGHGFRLLEYGCGGGMSLFKLVALLRRERADIHTGVGADFSPNMIEAARREASRSAPADLHDRIRFVVASNETLLRDLSLSHGGRSDDLEGSFDVVVGVNTFRYCHRLGKEVECARDIFKLLAPGGYSIMIDMNQRFPLFRSRLSNMFQRGPEEECYIPTLAEYTRPFERAGFAVTESRNFCWFPHSAGPTLVRLCRVLAPMLDLSCPSFAMRSLVVAQRPLGTRA